MKYNNIAQYLVSLYFCRYGIVKYSMFMVSWQPKYTKNTELKITQHFVECTFDSHFVTRHASTFPIQLLNCMHTTKYLHNI